MNRGTRRRLAREEQKVKESPKTALKLKRVEAELDAELAQDDDNPQDSFIVTLLTWKQWEQQRLLAKVNYQLEARFKGDKARLLENYLNVKKRLTALESDMVNYLKQIEKKDIMDSLLTDTFRLATGESLRCGDTLAKRLRTALANGKESIEEE